MVALILEMKPVASRLIRISNDLPSNPSSGRTGGYLTLMTTDPVIAVQSVLVGEVADSEKLAKYSNLSREKALRLQADRLRDGESISSWQTREPGIKRYGGAVFFAGEHASHRPGYIVSFSGLAELTDEALSLTLGRFFKLGSDDIAQRVVEVSGNKVYAEMQRAFNA